MIGCYISSLFSLQLYHLEVFYLFSVDSKSEQGLHGLPALFACGARVHGEETVVLVVHHFQDMAVPADEKVNDVVAVCGSLGRHFVRNGGCM